MTTLWEEAGYDHDAMERTAALARVDAELQDVMPFLLMARTEQEYLHRRAMAEDRLVTIALRYGADPDEVAEVADRRFGLYHEAQMQRMALPEGQDPLGWVPDGGGFGSGPEKPDEHDEGPDFSHGYSEVPQGAPGGPVPQVTVPRQAQPAGVSEATAATRCPCGRRLKGGVCKACGSSPGECGCSPKKSASRRTADYLSEDPPDMGVGRGSVDTTVAPMGASLPSSVSPDDMQPQLPAGVGQVTSSADPVRRQVISVAASIAAANPGLPDSECQRVARQVVGRYLVTALSPDQLTNSQVSGDPGPPPESSGGGGDSGGGGHSPGLAEHYLMGKGLSTMLPGGGDAAGGAAEGGEAAGGLADLAELAPLALA
jgi:hypothetical protein